MCHWNAHYDVLKFFSSNDDVMISTSKPPPQPFPSSLAAPCRVYPPFSRLIFFFCVSLALQPRLGPRACCPLLLASPTRSLGGMSRAARRWAHGMSVCPHGPQTNAWDVFFGVPASVNAILVAVLPSCLVRGFLLFVFVVSFSRWCWWGGLCGSSFFASNVSWSWPSIQSFIPFNLT